MARKYFTVPFLTFRGRSTLAAPPVSRADESRIYYDSSMEAILVSNDGYAYLPLGTGTIVSTQRDTSIQAIANGKTVEVFGYQFAGSTTIDGYEWTGITFETVGSVSDEGLIHRIQLWNISTASEIITHDHSSTTPNRISTPVTFDNETILEVRHSLVGTPTDGYIGYLGTAQLVLLNRSSITVEPPDNGVLNRAPISIVGGAYTPTVDDSVILVNAVSAAITITLPDALDFNQYFFTIKKIDSTANIVTVTTAELIDGNATIELSSEDHGITVHSNGSTWHITRDARAPGGSGTAVSTPIATKTTSYLATTDDHTILCDAASAPMSIALPSAASSYLLGAGLVLYIKKTDSSANAVTIEADGAETIDSAVTQTLSAQNESVAIQSDGANWWII